MFQLQKIFRIIAFSSILSLLFGMTEITTAQIIINEVDADTPGVDSLEFVELYDGGTGNTDLSGLVIVFFNGSDDASYQAFDLDGFSTDANGFFLLGNSAVTPTPSIIFNNNGLQNGADAVALYTGDATDFPNDTPVTTNNLIDAVVYDTNDNDDAGLLPLLNAGQPQVNEDGAGDKDNHSNQRIPNGSGGARNTNTYSQFPPTPGTQNEGSGQGQKVELFEIQGAGLVSPLENETVVTDSNVVTAMTADGFFMQTPENRADNDPTTSDGIFVFTNLTPAVAIGDLVNVTGRVVEFSELTAISDTPTIEIVSSGNPLPAPIEFDAATPSPIQPQPETELERYEGMLVKVMNGTVTAPSNSFDEAKIVAGPNRAFREPGVEFPGLPGLPVWDGNPEIFELDPDGAGLPNIQIPGGIEIESATGPLSFNFGDYQLLPTELNLNTTIAPRPVRDRTSLEETIGTQNLLLLFDDVADPNNQPPTDPTEYANRLNKFSLQIREVLKAPDILAVQEVENLNTLQDLADKIQSDDPAVVYTPFLEEGNDESGINVGFLVRNSVQVNSVTQIGKDATYEFEGQTLTLHDRPPLILDAVIDTAGTETVQVMVVHNRSLSGIDGDDSTRVRTKRFEQALWISQQIQEMQTADSNINLVVLGDFNAFQFTDGYVDVLGQITGNLDAGGAFIPGTDEVNPDLRNQVLDLPEEERYSFIFKGSAQVLDHVLTSSALENAVSGIEFGRGNADAPASFADSANTALRSSDHDGLVLFLDLGPVNSVTEPFGASLPNEFALAQNYPNPFNPATVITYDLKKRVRVGISVYNLLGQKIETLVDAIQDRGIYLIRWHGTDSSQKIVPSGVYILQMRAGDFAATRKMLFLK
ncbi:T9SS type A sorting domain-containing protein [candidate division KSB1 bacterium]|nr:T9SS type A sorting domain-containing protein [candidate division KSB1 bacterium]